MKYVRIEGGKVSQRDYTIAKLRRDNPDTSFGAEPTAETLAEFGVFILDETPPPSVTVGQVTEEEDPILVDGVWTQQWSVRSKTSQELADAKAELRSAVNGLRDALQDGQVTTPFGVFDCNERSRVFINGGVTEALIRQMEGDDSPLTFTTADNRDVSLAPAEMIAAGRMVLGHISAVHFYAREMKEAIEATKAFVDLDKIEIEKGWPDA